MLEATSPNGNNVLVRVWPRRTKADEDLFDIWRHELRQLHRLGGYPGAHEYIAALVDAGSDSKGFYIVLDAEQRQPLEVRLERGRTATDWLRSLNLPANRHRLWNNLKRVARGLEILHHEGLVHRNLDGWSVLTAAGDDPDFQLTGFEWSLRLAATADTPKRDRTPEVPTISFAADWAAFAELAARIFNITLARLRDPTIPDYEVHESASAGEIRLLRDLLLPNELPRIDGELVSNRIDQQLEALDAARSAVDGRYYLVLRLGRESDLSRTVREASDLSIEIDDVEAQQAWIEADLGSSVTLLASGDANNLQLFMRGRELLYRLKQYRGTNDEPTWQFAFCESAEATSAWRRSISGKEEVLATSLNLLRHTAARDTYQRVRGRTPSWAKQIERLKEAAPVSITREMQVHRALTLLHALEIAFASASIFPVTVRAFDQSSGLATLVYRAGPEAEEISRALGLEAPLKRLRDGLELEALGEGEGWIFTEAARLGQAQAGDLELTFDTIEASGADVLFRFRATRQTALLFREGYLVPASSRGDFVQLQRRSKALRLLKGHTELLQSLADPRGRLIETHDVLREDQGYMELDVAKQASLKALIAVLPMYLLQGPPGVGKTFLIKDLVRRRFDEDRASRLLVTAQGNHAIDHLLDELTDLWSLVPEQAPLAVRCRPKDDRTDSGPFDLSTTTAQLANKIAKSKLAASASQAMQTRLQTLTGTAGVDASKAAFERRSLEGLVMRSANLVFATTNSVDLERLVEERGQFDWTVVEEAGKATGTELITPLMLSHRRLMIGDHKQLPPFGSQELEALLESEAKVRLALKVLPRTIDTALHNLLDEDLLEFMEEEEQEVATLCTEARRVLFLFESMLTAELDRQNVRPGGMPIASTLRVQHRMHPVICDLVSATFYGDLITSEKRTKDAAEQESWIASRSPTELPDLPLVIVDMPYERSSIGKGRIERLPRFTNEDEAEEVVRALARLSVTDKALRKPSLVILTPYARQVSRLKEAILSDPSASAALKEFKPVARGSEWVSTVDAFQGNEADVVIFSLVRNNRGATIRRALGFVGDRRRFNVLLSRARQRLVFIGSKQFLETISQPMGLENDPSSDFLRKFLKRLEELLAKGLAARVVGKSAQGAVA